MSIFSHWRTRLAGVACAVCLISPAGADTLMDTGSPGGFFGYYGYDVFVGQSVAIAFTPTQNYSFDNVSMWLMSNDFDGAGRMLNISLQTNDGGGATPAPSGTMLESWAYATQSVGWTPLLETLNSVSHPLLQAGQTYWIVATSNEPAFVDPIWVVADGNGGTYWMGNIDYASSPDWQVGETGGPVGVIISATPVPEPSTLAFAALGVPLLLGIARRRARSSTQA